MIRAAVIFARLSWPSDPQAQRLGALPGPMVGGLFLTSRTRAWVRTRESFVASRLALPLRLADHSRLAVWVRRSQGFVHATIIAPRLQPPLATVDG
jgi:hypothetical protein